mmetsp:Transcript_61053/g.162103  ORF Transcript_61053/g.162103 Transcript_61053/m.162103 type:complete len:146 (-) Transcript_61053:164-601(-)
MGTGWLVVFCLVRCGVAQDTVPALYVYDYMYSGGSFTLQVSSPTVGGFIKRSADDWTPHNALLFDFVGQVAQTGLSKPVRGELLAILSDGTECHFAYTHDADNGTTAVSDCEQPLVHAFSTEESGLSIVFEVMNLQRNQTPAVVV